MKLVDILARELKEWPLLSYEFVAQESDGEIYFYMMREDAKYSGANTWLRGENGSLYAYPSIFLTRSDDWQTSVVSKQEWQSTRAAYLASIQPARDPEIAAVVDKPANPWRRNRGRKTPPVPRGVLVDYKMRGDATCYSDLAEELTWHIDGDAGDIMQWRYAEPQQAEENPTVHAPKSFDPIALRDEFKRITLECEELSQQMGKLTDRIGEIEAALRAEGFALVETE